IKNDGHYFCRAGGNRPDGLNEPVTANDGYDTKDEWELAAIFKKTYTQGRGLDATNTGGSLTPSPTLHSRGSIGNTGGRETRPRNIAFNYIVRAA
ncbi:hypothetical protein OSK27_24810, partial [Escherichia coli]|nr:hypothetical protein [Escherichia coli]